MIAVSEVGTIEELRALRGAWEEAHRRSGDGGIFLRWSWVFTWCEEYGRDQELRVMVVRDAGGAVLAIAPFCTHRAAILGAPVRILKLLTWKDACSEMLDLLVADPSRLGEIEAALRGHLERRLADWDLIEFRDLRPESALSRIVLSLAESRGLRAWERPRTFNPYLRLPRTAEEYVSSLSRNTRESIRRPTAKLSREHRIRYRTVTNADEVKEAFPVFVGLHEKLWASRGQPGVFRRERFARFHERVAARFAEEGLLRMHFLDVDEQPVAAMYGFRDERTYYFYQSGFDPAWSEYGVGKILFLHTILDSIGSGAEAYDFLRGTTPFKAKFTDETRRGFEVVAARRTPAASAFLAARSFRERLGGGARSVLPRAWVERWRRLRDWTLLR